MRSTTNLGLALYDASDKMNVTGSENSLNHNMELIDAAIAGIEPSGVSITDNENGGVDIYNGTVTKTLASQSDFSGLANCEPIANEDLVFTWSAGRISSGTAKPSLPNGYTNCVPYTDKKIVFDTSKYKILFVKCDASGNVQDYTGWRTSSPTDVPVNYPYFRIEAGTVDDSQFDLADAKTSITFDGLDYPLLTEKVLQNASEIETLKKKTIGCVYVNGSTGNNNNNGTSSAPFKTIQKGVDSGAKIVYVASGDYREVVYIEHIDEISILPMTYPTFSKTDRPDTPMIHITGGEGKSISSALRISDCGVVNITDVWCDNTSASSAISIRTMELNMTHCWFTNTATGDFNGLELVNTNGVFRDCLAYGIAKDGFNIHQYGNTQFINCSAHDCGDDGLSHHDACTGFVIGGEFYNCAKAGVATPTYGALVDVEGVYCHDNKYGFYSVNESDRRATKANIKNSVFKNNTDKDLYIGRSFITSWNNKYETKYVSENGTFTEL